MPYPAAQSALGFIPPRFNPAVRQGVETLLPAWRRWKTGLKQVQAVNAAELAQLYQGFQQGQTRLLVAFRHPSPEDPYCMAHLFWQAVPQAAKQQGIQLSHPVHAHFMFDRGIPLWTGRWTGWLYSQLGGLSIQRGKLDLTALKAARSLLLDGQFPLAAAPEGGNNGHGEIVSPLEPGIAQLGFWCADDLHKANRPERVVIVPVGIQYRYLSAPWEAIALLLGQLERHCGLGQLPNGPSQREMYDRLTRLAGHLLTLMESYYQRFFGVVLAPTDSVNGDATAQLSARLNRLMSAALGVAEQRFGLIAKGSVIDRCRRLEQAGWDRIFRDDIGSRAALSPVELGLADRVAAEADLQLWHMRLVENFVAVTGHYVLEQPTVERFAETLLLLRDMVVRIEGKHPFPRPRLGPQRGIITVGQPVSVSDRYADYRKSRKQAVEALTRELRSELERLIIPATPSPPPG